MQVPFGKPVIGDAERAAVQDVLAGTTLTHGPRVKEFERAFADFTGAEHAIATASCMASLHLAYLAIDLGPGDEVIVPAQTHVAMAHAVEACGGTPVFCDAEPRTGNIDLERLEGLVSQRTRAVSVVHFLGRPVNMERVLDIARRHDLYVVEDCAIALGARIDGVHAGLKGDIGCFSFYPVKHITTGEGGMVITRRVDVAERVSKQRAFGIDKTFVAERRHSGAYDVDQFGLNYRLGEIPAAIGIEQLKRLPGFLEARERNYTRLADALRGVDGLEPLESHSRDGARSSHYCLSALLDEALVPHRETIIESLKARGFGTSIYYPRPLPETAHYSRASGSGSGEFPVAARISYGSIAFPVGPHVTDADVDSIVEATQRVIEEVGAHV
jgi:perosamine synthetase